MNLYPTTSPVAATTLTDSSAPHRNAVSPTSQADRIQTLDILRGVALLGILLMNIPFFALADNFVDGLLSDPTNVNFWVNAGITILFEGKMRALFSMIFGVGIILFMARKEKAGPGPGGEPHVTQSATGLFFRRMGWLVLFGLIDSHVLLWMGDILYSYGIIGMIAFWFRKMKPVYLALGVPLVAIIGFALITIFFQQDVRQKRLAFLAVQTTQQHGQPLTAAQQQAVKDWQGVEKTFFPNPAQAEAHKRLMKSNDYLTVASRYRQESIDFQTKYLPLTIWDPLALMLLGMALYKWGFVTGQWSRRRYWQTLLIGYGLGIPLVTFSFYYSYQNFPNQATFLSYLKQHSVIWVNLIYPFQRILLVMAHASLLILLIKSGQVRGLLNRLGAVGQMAFTNYVMHTLICTFVFFGYGLNQYAEWQFYQLYYLVAAIWVLQLIVSPIWLRYFQFGPLEWVWRSLTYWKRQPMRRATDVD